MLGIYQVVMVHQGQHVLAQEIGNAILEATAEVVGRDDLLEIIADMPDSSPDSHVVVVYVGSVAGADDPSVEDEIQRALASGFAVLPIVRVAEAGKVAKSLPSLIKQA